MVAHSVDSNYICKYIHSQIDQVTNVSIPKTG